MSDNLHYILGLDLGQSNDYTALAIAEMTGFDPPPIAIYWSDLKDREETETIYTFGHLERFPLHTPYTTIVQRVKALLAMPQFRGRTHLVVDSTGVGRPVIDLLRKEGLEPIAVTITAGVDVTNEDEHNYRVPKRDLVSNTQVLFQSNRIRIARRLPEADILVQELMNFQTKITAAGNDIYGAWREGTHDDLVLAVALATWYGEKAIRRHPLAVFP